MRLFIALQLNEACRDAIAEAIDAMRAQGIRANYVPEDNLHVTLTSITKSTLKMAYHPMVETLLNNPPYVLK